MKIAVVASDMPHPEGTASGRDLWAWCEAMLALGHELEAWIWHRSPLSPEGPVPEWARYEPVVVPPSLRAHLHALFFPRTEPVRGGWRPPPDAVAVADHLPSASAVLGFAKSVVTLHYRAMADARSLRRLRPADVQMARAEHRAARRADLVIAYSDRVGHGLAKPARFVPITCPMPERPVPGVDQPVVALMADWWWRPNRLALSRLLAMWPTVREAVPSARLLLAGRNLPSDTLGTMAGVEVVGPVANSIDVLGRAGLVAFPCPNSSGPKVKILEALAYGIPVVTSRAGVEGIVLPPGGSPMIATNRDFAQRMIALLRSPEDRAQLGAAAREAVIVHHSPMAAARARLNAFTEAFDT
ncbi:MAG: glycosyltransferase family 4 protein [Acidimicrobiales bacterium]